MPEDMRGRETGHPAAQFSLSNDLLEQLGDSAGDYARALWELAQHNDLDPDEMTGRIEDVNERFGVVHPDIVVERMQEIFRNSGGLVTIICEDRVLAGALSGEDSTKPPHTHVSPDDFSDTAG